MQRVHVFSTYDKDMSIHSQPSIRIDDSLRTVEHRLAQRVKVLGSVFGIISILFLYLFLLCPSIFPQRIKLETCSCAQNVRLEIPFPAVLKFLSFHCGKLVEIRLKACYPDPFSYFSSSTAKLDYPFFDFDLMYLLNE